MKQQEEMMMGTGRIDRLMLKMGIPMILSMMLQAVYNIVDSAFVSNMPENGEAAINALTLAFPIQMLMVAVGIGTGVGTNALLAKSLGQGEREKASRTAGNAVFLGGVIYAIFLFVGLLGVKPYINSQTENALSGSMAQEYLTICCVLSFGIVFFSIYEKLLQATGRTQFSTIAQIAGAAVNMLLDPILIYGWLGLPAMGVRGAAYATVAGQVLSMLLALVLHLKYNVEISNGKKYMKPDGKLIREIYTIGLPAIVSQALMSVMTYGLNIILGKVDEAAVTAYGLYYKIQQFLLFAAFGLRDAITPIVSFNYGKRSKSRVLKGIKCGMFYTFIIMLAGLAVLELSAEVLTNIFGLSGQTQQLCISAIRIISLSFVFAGANIAYQGIFQALGGGMESLVLSLGRQFVFVLPPAWGMAQAVVHLQGPTWLIWLVFPLAEAVTMVIAVFFMKRIGKKIALLEDF